MEKKKIYVTPNFKNMRIIENPFLPKDDIPSVITKPEDVEKYWDDFNECYMFGQLIIQCALDLSEYSITATSISTVKPLIAQSITCEGKIIGTKIKAKEINCVSIMADEVYVDTLIYSEICTVTSLSVVTLHPSTSRAVEKCNKIIKRES